MWPVRTACRVLPFVVLLVACNSGGSGGSAATTAGAPAATTSTTATTTSTTSTTTTTAPARLVLEADGLGVVAVGATKDATVAAISAVAGPPDSTGKGCELGGPGPTTVTWKELTVQFSTAGRFASYAVHPAAGTTGVLNLRTRLGIGSNATVAALKATYGANVKIPGLPPDVFGGKDFAISFGGTNQQLLGSVSATTDDGRITGFFTTVCE